jgi:hypothetical protein
MSFSEAIMFRRRAPPPLSGRGGLFRKKGQLMGQLAEHRPRLFYGVAFVVSVAIKPKRRLEPLPSVDKNSKGRLCCVPAGRPKEFQIGQFDLGKRSHAVCSVSTRRSRRLKVWRPFPLERLGGRQSSMDRNNRGCNWSYCSTLNLRRRRFPDNAEAKPRWASPPSPSGGIFPTATSKNRRPVPAGASVS